MFKKTATALILATLLAPSFASAMSLPTLLPPVSYPEAPTVDVTKGD